MAVKDPRIAKVKTVNGKLLDSTIRHAHYIEQYKNDLSQKVVGVFNDAIPDLQAKVQQRLSNISARGYDTGPKTSKRLKNLLANLQADVQAAVDVAKGNLTTNALSMAKVEAQWQANIIQANVPVALDLVTPNAALLRSILTSNPMQGHLLKDWFDNLTDVTATRLTQQINIGLVQGESVPQIVTRLFGTRVNNYTDGVLNSTRRDVEGIVRTAINHVSTHAREATYGANSNVVQNVQMVATLDTRTTLFCIKIDGQVFPVNEGPRPPFHFNCRTTTVPVLKSWKELGIDLKEAPPSTRASMNGQVADTITYPDWLKEQSNAIQDEALGPKRAALFRSGELTVDQFVNDKGRTLTLDQLAKKYDITVN